MSEQKQKHTPGPWEIGPEGQVRAITGRQICDPRQWTSEGQANARMIAAAPELLVALKECIDEITAPTFGSNGYAKAIAVCAKARAAIAKAEGGDE